MIKKYLWIPAFAGMTTLCFGAAEPTGKAICQKNFSSYKERVTKNPTDDEAWTELRVCAQELKKWDDAIQAALQARQKNRELSQPYLILGLAQMQQKNYERAVEHFDQSIALKSDQPIAYFQMGMAYLFLNETAKAQQAAERAVELDATNPAHHRQLSYTLLLAGDLAGAEASAKKALSLDPNDLAAHKILAKIYAKTGNTLGMTQELALAKTAEVKYAQDHPETVKKPEPVPAKPVEDDDEEDKKSGKQEDYQIIGQCIGQWTGMKDAIMHEQLPEALGFYSDYLDTRDLYKASFEKLGPQKLKGVFANFGELYDCEVVFASAHCKAVVTNSAGTSVVTKIRFERNPDKVWRIRSF